LWHTTAREQTLDVVIAQLMRESGRVSNLLKNPFASEAGKRAEHSAQEQTSRVSINPCTGQAFPVEGNEEHAQEELYLTCPWCTHWFFLTN
jgi:hypothetical protein